MNLSAVIAAAEPPADLDPLSAAIWRELAPGIEIRVARASDFAALALSDPEGVKRMLLSGFERVCSVVAAVRQCRAAGLPLPRLHPLDVELLATFGIRPKWLLH